MNIKLPDKLTGTLHQTQAQENDIEVKVTLAFSMPNDGIKRNSDERRQEIVEWIHGLFEHEVLAAVADYEVLG